MQSITLEHTLTTCSTQQAGNLLLLAAWEGDDAMLRTIIDHLKGKPDRSILLTREAFVPLADRGRWDLCANLLDLFPDKNDPWVQARCWEAAASHGHDDLLDHLHTFGLEHADISIHPIADKKAKTLFAYVMQHRLDQLPTLDQNNRICGQILCMAACCGPACCQQYIDHLRKTNQPAHLVETKMDRILGIAWENAMRDADQAAATTLAELGLWGSEGYVWAALFASRLDGVDICKNPSVREALAQSLLVLPAGRMEDFDRDVFKAMDQAGLPVFQWRGEHGQHVAHLLMGRGEPKSSEIAWLMARAPGLFATPDDRGALPVDAMRGKHVEDVRKFSQQLLAMAQANELEHYTPPADKTRNSPRL